MRRGWRGESGAELASALCSAVATTSIAARTRRAGTGSIPELGAGPKGVPRVDPGRAGTASVPEGGAGREGVPRVDPRSVPKGGAGPEGDEEAQVPEGGPVGASIP